MTETARHILTVDKLKGLHARYWPEVEAEIRKVTAPGGIPDRLSEMAFYHLDTGGKRLRALIPLALVEAWGGDPMAAVPFAAAVEMVHNATLVHDDLQDGDTHRRGRETVWRRYGMAQAINCGDAMFFYAVRLVHALDVPPALTQRLVDLLARCTISVIGGQVAEFDLKESDAPTLEGYLAMVRGKTGGLFTLPIVGAALLSSVPSRQLSALATIGDDLGVVFQVQDDVLDLVGDKGRDQRGTDIAEGKISLPAAHLLESAGPDAGAELLGILRKPREETTGADITRAIELYEEHGSIRHAIDLIRDQEVEIDACARSLDNPAVHALLTDLTDVFLQPIRPHLPALQ